MRDDFDAQSEPYLKENADRPGLIKQAAGMIGTLAAWGIGLAAAHQVFRRGKTALLKRLRAHPNFDVAKAAARSLSKYEETGGSLSHFYDEIGGPGGGLLARLRFAAEDAPIMKSYKALKGTTSVFERRQILAGKAPMRISEKVGTRLLTATERREIYTGMASGYVREIATISPLFYGAEQVLGRPDQNAHKRDQTAHPAWYNIPGHAVNFAKWLPGFVAFDLVARGAMKAVPLAYQTAMDKGIKSESMRWLVKGIKKEQEFRTRQATKDNIFIQARASIASFKHLVGSHRTARNADPFPRHRGWKGFSKWFDSTMEKFSKKKDFYVNEYVKNLRPINEASSRYLMGDTLMSLISPSGSKVAGYKNIFSLLRQAGGMGGKLRTRIARTLFSERTGDELPFLARLSGLQSLRVRHLRQVGMKRQAKEIEEVWKTAIKDAGLKLTGSEPATKEFRLLRKKGPKTRKLNSVEDLVLSDGLFWDPKAKQIVDLKNTSGHGLIKSTISMAKKSLTLFGRFSALDLFPIRAFAGESMPNIVIAGKSLVPPSSGKNIYNEQMKFTHGPGIFIRDPGKRTYTLFSRDRAGESYQIVAQDLFGMSKFDSQKMAKVYELSRRISPSRVGEFDHDEAGPIRSFLFKHFNIGGGPMTKERESMLQIGMAHWKGQSRAWAILSPKGVLRNLPNLRKFVADPDSGLQMRLLSNVYSQARVQAFKVLGKDDIWKKLMEPLLLGKGANKQTHIQGMRGAKYTIDELLLDSPNKDGIVPIMDVVERLMSKETGPAIIADTQQLKSLQDMIKYNITHRTGGELPATSARRALTEYHIQRSLLQRKVSFGVTEDASNIPAIKQQINDVLNNVLNVSDLAKQGIITRKEQALVNMAVQGMAWESVLRNIGTRRIASGRIARPNEVLGTLFGTDKNLSKAEYTEANFIMKFLKEMQTDLPAGKGGSVQFSKVWDDYREALGKWTTLELPRNATVGRSLMEESLQDNPYIWFHNTPGTWGNALFQYGADTFGTVMDWVGLGWDRGHYNQLFGRKHGVLNLWGRRLALAGGVAAAYRTIDTFTDVNPMFEGTALDEGVTVALADQAVRARMISSYIYDTFGVTKAMKYMEGLMPKSSKILPGAALGFAAGGIPGMMIGGLLNAYVQPQLAEGPLAFLSVLPPLAPFVADMTKSYDELRDIYSGKEWVPVRRGSGWPLGNQPIEGGRITQYRPNWYRLLKSQYAASPVAYGSKMEQYLFKDLPLLDFSFGDIIAPRYLEQKHTEDRPYPVPDAPFSEIPIIGPLAGATIGRAWMAIHPFGSTKSPLADEAANWINKGYGPSEEGFGPQYAGSFGDQSPQGAAIRQATGGHIIGSTAGMAPVVQSPFSAHQILAEQIYRGVIEPPGLLGWAISSVLWGGDEPYTDEPVFASAGAMDSFRRSYWDQNLGDPLLLTEGIRRLIPRPRTSFEEVNPLPNTMPNWLPEEYRTGDPYCLTPDTPVETINGLIPASEVTAGTLIRTVHGRYYPVSKVKERHVEEKVYRIKLHGNSHIIEATGEHPFLILQDGHNNLETWVLAKDLQPGQSVVYPRLYTEPKSIIKLTTAEYINQTDHATTVPLSVYTLRLISVILKYRHIKLTLSNVSRKIPNEDASLFTESMHALFNVQEYKKPLDGLYEIVNTRGIPFQLYSVPEHLLAEFFRTFITDIDLKDNRAEFTFENESIAYQAWSILIQHKVGTLLEGNKLVFYNWWKDLFDNVTSPANKAFWLSLIGSRRTSFSSNELDFLRFSSKPDVPRHAYIKVESVEEIDYSGPVYGYQVDTDDTFCVAGCVVHNTRIPMGEALLPGTGFESLVDVKVDFPVGASRLGYSAYEQALHMVGLSDPLEKDVEEILDTGTAIHRMVQADLARKGVITKAEAFIYDPYYRIASYVDGVMKQMNGEELPLEIKTINTRGFQQLKKPKHKHMIQLNTYMHIMNVRQGSILYINREDPSQTREFQVRYDPKLWESTIDELEAARSYASQWLQQGYGNKINGYSYLDRMQVLLNANPFSREYNEASKVVAEQERLGLLDDEDQKRYERIKRWQVNMSRRYEMYNYRFQGMQLIEPDNELRQYNTNTLLKSAAEYGPIERLVGNVWEKFTHLRSPIHTKLINTYSAEEQYERNVLYGSSFYDWQRPIDTMLEPWSRGLKSVTDPVQGSISFGLGGFVLGGPAGAVAGTLAGAVYGTIHGAYRAITGTKYIPSKFKKMAEIEQYFDRLEYDKARYLWMATKDPQYQTDMARTAIGWSANARISSPLEDRIALTENQQRAYVRQNTFRQPISRMLGYEIPVINTVFDQGDNRWTRISREANNPEDFDLSPDMGFASPWRGMRTAEALQYDALNVGGGVAAAPYWDKPFFTAFLDTPEDRRDKILQMVDDDMAMMLKSAWKMKGSHQPTIEEFFETHYKPSTSSAVYAPESNIDDWKYKTIEQEGLVAHDFGVGWRKQIRSINNSPLNITPLNINAVNEDLDKHVDMSNNAVKSAIQRALNNMGFLDPAITSSSSPSVEDKIILRIKINRDATSEIIKAYEVGKNREPRQS